VRHIRFIMTALAVGCGCPAPSFAQSGQAGPAAAMEQRSAQFAGSYLQVWSSSSRAAVAAVPRLYAPRVLFYGRVLGRRGLMREKARFVQRWPVRHYAHRPGTMRVSTHMRPSAWSGPWSIGGRRARLGGPPRGAHPALSKGSTSRPRALSCSARAGR
jgi:hypothetical protein